MKITNITAGNLGLDMETVVPAHGSIEIDNEALIRLKASPVVKGWLISGALVENGPVEEKPKPRKRGGAKADK